MIIVDTSVWVEHLRAANPSLSAALNAGHVASHPWVVGELALGGASAEVLNLLGGIPQAPVAEPTELLGFIRRFELVGTGIGWVDAQLLASARLLASSQIATADRRLRTQAERLGVSVAL